MEQWPEPQVPPAIIAWGDYVLVHPPQMPGRSPSTPDHGVQAGCLLSCAPSQNSFVLKLYAGRMHTKLSPWHLLALSL